jgi:hypothetical protein
MQEVNAWVQFKELERKLKERGETVQEQPPTQEFIPKLLVTPFLAKVVPALETMKAKK